MAMQLILRKVGVLVANPTDPEGVEVIRNIPMIGNENALIRQFDDINALKILYLYTKEKDGKETVRVLDSVQAQEAYKTPVGDLTGSLGIIHFRIDVRAGILSFTRQWIGLREQELGKPPEYPWITFSTDFIAERK